MRLVRRHAARASTIAPRNESQSSRLKLEAPNFAPAEVRLAAQSAVMGDPCSTLEDGFRVQPQSWRGSLFGLSGGYAAVLDTLPDQQCCIG